MDNKPSEERKLFPGNKIKVIGILTSKTHKNNLLYPVIESLFWEVKEEDFVISEEDKIRIQELSKSECLLEDLVGNFCSTVLGNEKIKEALILQSVGGVTDTKPDKSLKRGSIHILLVGDPATAKTRLGRFQFNYTPKAQFQVCSEVTHAGLGASMSKDKETEMWILTAGALPLAHKSIAVLDEIDKASTDDIKSLDTVMELQELPIAKAGLIMTLPSMTSVLAIANPTGSRFDPYQSIKDQIKLTEVTLSRFDLKFIFKDIPDKEKDTKITEKMGGFSIEDCSKGSIDPNFLAKYIIYAKQFTPKLTKQSFDILQKYYVELRGSSGEGVLQITPRQFDGLMRITEAYAKLRLSSETTENDANNAISMFEHYLQSLGYDPETKTVDIDRAEGKTDKKTRDKMINIREIIEMLEISCKDKALAEKFKYEGVPIKDLYKECEEHGIKGAEVIINKMKQEGLILEPRTGIIQLV